jgi:tagaturonate reductase
MGLPILDHQLLPGRPELCGQAHEVERLISLPEKVIQFGTGVLLRGLPDYYIDRANKAGIFNGRIVVVKTTDRGSMGEFARQDYLFTHLINGLRDGQVVQEAAINCSISRILEARQQWIEVLVCAADPNISLVISNTTESGLVYLEESIFEGVPESFPGKLLAFLFHRFEQLGGGNAPGLTIVPTELIENNGSILREYLLQGARYNHLDDDFIHWLNTANTFCNSLVDRIVSGKPAPEKAEAYCKSAGYSDSFMIESEPYDLWAIEGDPNNLPALSFAPCNPGIHIVADISLYKELKLRLLNGTHILACGKALLAGFSTVREGFASAEFRSWAIDLMAEIQQSIPIPIESDIVGGYARSVLQRFENPFIEHQWSSILLNYSSKIRIRALPLLLTYYQRYRQLPAHILEGFTAYLAIAIPDEEVDGNYFKYVHGQRIMLQDPLSPALFRDVINAGAQNAAERHLGDTAFWGTPPTSLPGFKAAVLRVFEKHAGT